jgi:hypothetical protein
MMSIGSGESTMTLEQELTLLENLNGDIPQCERQLPTVERTISLQLHLYISLNERKEVGRVLNMIFECEIID